MLSLDAPNPTSELDLTGYWLGPRTCCFVKQAIYGISARFAARFVYLSYALGSRHETHKYTSAPLCTLARVRRLTNGKPIVVAVVVVVSFGPHKPSSEPVLFSPLSDGQLISWRGTQEKLDNFAYSSRATNRNLFIQPRLHPAPARPHRASLS